MTNKELQQLAKLLQGENIDRLLVTQAWDNFIKVKPLRVRSKTIDYYKHQWDYATDFLTSIDIIYMKDITINVLEQLQMYYKKKGYSNSSINKFTDIIKIVYKFNFIHNFISDYPIRDFKKLKQDTPETITISKEIQSKIFNYLDSLDNNLVNLRNKLIIYILAETGVRLNELLNIETENVNVKENTIHLSFTKTHVERDVYFSNKTKKLIIAYQALISPTKHFFQMVDARFKGAKMTKVPVYKLLDHLKRKLKIKQSISPHKWRHTLATELANSGLPLKEVMSILGHTEITTTQRYVHADEKKTKKDVINVLKIFNK